METLETYEFTRGRTREQYDYSKLFDGAIYRLRRGQENFPDERKISSLRSYLSAQARKRGKHLSTQIEDDDNLVIQATALEGTTNGSTPPKRRRQRRKPAEPAVA